MKWQRRLGWMVALGLVVGWTASSSAVEENGSITGKVLYKGEVPKRTKIKVGADPVCAALHTPPAGKPMGTEKFLFNKKSGTLRNVIVFVKGGLGDATYPAPAESATLDQSGCRYNPHIVTMRTGQTLVIKNSDDTMHNINGKPKKNSPFNFGQPKAGMTKELSFKRAEIFKVKCDVHSWMNAYIGLFDHPFYSVTGKDGVYTLSGLPPGEYEIVAWHEGFGEAATQTVTVKAGEATEADLTIEEKK